MSHLCYYEAERGFELDGFVDPVDMSSAIRVVAPPNAKSSHALAGAICRSLGAVRDLYTIATGETVMLSSAAAWSLATGVTDVYIAAAEDLTRPAVFDCIDFAGRIGAHLHLVFSYGQVHAHAHTINEAGFRSRPFNDLPTPLRHPTLPPVTLPDADRGDQLNGVALPEDQWTTFRAAYRTALTPDLASYCDGIYLDAYRTTRDSDARTVDDVAALAGALWQRLGIGEVERTVTSRAMQAALFRNGLLVRLDMRPFTRHVQQNHVNLMTADDYQALRGFVNPWRAAATVLHAYHVSTEESLALKATDVTPTGDIPRLALNPPPEARVLLAAQRWHQLLTQDADPPLFKEKPVPLRRGIRAVIQELNLPLIAYWRTLSNDKGQGNTGIKVEEIA